MSNEPSFTPGPWEWWTSNSWKRLTSAHPDHPRIGGVLCPYVCSDGHPDVSITKYDMALIEAAPDLYRALEQLHDNTMEYIAINKLGGEDNHDLREARAALSKATGEQNEQR